MPAHLFLVHFPVALLTVGAALDLGGAAARSERVRRAAGVLLMLGSAAVVAAFLTGQDAVTPALERLQFAGATGLDTHTQWAAGALWAAAPAAVLRAMWRDRMHGPRAWATLAAGVLSAAVVVLVTLSGMALAHGGG